jgi:hypothetical protein
MIAMVYCCGHRAFRQSVADAVEKMSNTVTMNNNETMTMMIMTRQGQGKEDKEKMMSWTTRRTIMTMTTMMTKQHQGNNDDDKMDREMGMMTSTQT